MIDIDFRKPGFKKWIGNNCNDCCFYVAMGIADRFPFCRRYTCPCTTARQTDGACGHDAKFFIKMPEEAKKILKERETCQSED